MKKQKAPIKKMNRNIKEDAEMAFARKLAGNVASVREKSLRKLKRWLQSRSADEKSKRTTIIGLGLPTSVIL